jgi:WD40 repeat protein
MNFVWCFIVSLHVVSASSWRTRTAEIEPSRKIQNGFTDRHLLPSRRLKKKNKTRSSKNHSKHDGMMMKLKKGSRSKKSGHSRRTPIPPAYRQTPAPSAPPPVAQEGSTSGPSIPVTETTSPTQNPTSRPTFSVPDATAIPTQTPVIDSSVAPTLDKVGNEFNWSLRGFETLVYAETDTMYGDSVAISDDGSIIAVGIPFFPSFIPGVEQKRTGAVQVLRWSAMQQGWQPLGSLIEGVESANNEEPYFGRSVALSGSGLRVAAAAPGQQGGVVKVYQYSDTISDWQPLGQSIRDIESPSGSFGHIVSLSSDGKTLAVGYPSSVSMYLYDLVNDDQWELVGALEGSSGFGSVIALSKDGQIVAASSGSSDPQGQTETRAYRRLAENGGWEPLGGPIYTELGEYQTRGTALSSDGSTIAVASKRFADGTAYVKVMNWSGNSVDLILTMKTAAVSITRLRML